MKRFVELSVVLLVTGSIIGMVWANGAVDSDGPAIMVSPSTLVLHSLCDNDQITVHSNISFASVAVSSLTVTFGGVSVPASFWADDCGDLVARISIDRGSLQPGALEVELSGTQGEEDFTASKTVTVKP